MPLLWKRAEPGIDSSGGGGALTDDAAAVHVQTRADLE